MIAFEVNIEDVKNVAKEHFNKKITNKKAEKILVNLDLSKVEESALYGTNLNKQTEYAYDEIRTQILLRFLL